MKRLYFLILLSLSVAYGAFAGEKPWDHGRLVTVDGRYFGHEDGTPFFWLGDTGWLLPERLDMDEAVQYLDRAAEAGFNVVQVQTVNDVPAVNRYGALSHPSGYDFTSLPANSYWDHLDRIVECAEQRGIYIGMVCIWGGLVKKGLMDEEQAREYGRFLAKRYGHRPNIVWIIGGDIRGDVKPEVWNALAESIRSIDREHLMTFHPFGRTLSALWFSGARWLDFHMFQSGHRRYGQSKDYKESLLPEKCEEDNWRYVDISRRIDPSRPVIDGEPSYEAIPQGLHDPNEGFWQAADVRRYAYWSVFAGAAGHTYGHNSIMQFYDGKVDPAYGATVHWRDALDAEGFNQMRHLKTLMQTLRPYSAREATGRVLNQGERYDRIAAVTDGETLMAYTFNGRDVELDVTGLDKNRSVTLFDPRSGRTLPAESTLKGDKLTVSVPRGNDWVVVVAPAR